MSSSGRKINQGETVDLSSKKLMQIPPISNPTYVTSMNIANNLFTSLPDLKVFSNLQHLFIDHNSFTDLSFISSLHQLQELDVSYNALTTLDFLQDLPNIRIVYAAHNKISTIKPELPSTLNTLDVSYNQLTSLKFIESSSWDSLECLTIHDNLIFDLREIKYLAELPILKYCYIGFSKENMDTKLAELAKFVCPTLLEFDDFNTSNLNPDFDQYQVIHLLSAGTEAEFRSFVNLVEQEIKWNQPVFIDFVEKAQPREEDDLEKRLRAVEAKVSTPAQNEELQARIEEMEKKISNAVDKQDNDKGISELDQIPGGNVAKVQQIQSEINDIRQQITKITELLYAHDKALETMWNYINPLEE